jgi:hypothetical protein
LTIDEELMTEHFIDIESQKLLEQVRDKEIDGNLKKSPLIRTSEELLELFNLK